MTSGVILDWRGDITRILSRVPSLIRVPSVGWRIREPGSRFVPRICSINFSSTAGLVFGISSPLPILDPSPSHSRGADYFGQPLVSFRRAAAYRSLTDIPRAGPAFPDFADAPFKNAVVRVPSARRLGIVLDVKPAPAIPLRRVVQSHEKYCVDLLTHLYFRQFHSNPLQICQPDSVEKGDKLS